MNILNGNGHAAQPPAERWPAGPLSPDNMDRFNFFLMDLHYAGLHRLRICECVLATRSLADVVADGTLDTEDEARVYDQLESLFPPVGNDAWDWDLFSEGDRFELGPPIPRDAVLVPPELDIDAENGAFWPGATP